MSFQEIDIVIELIQENLALSTLLGFVSLSGLIALYEKLTPKSSDVHIRQRHETGAVIRQPNRIDIDLFLYAENSGDLTGTIEFCMLTDDITFIKSDDNTQINISGLDRQEARITSPSPGHQALSPGDGFPVTLRFSFAENGRMADLILKYSEMEISWGIRIVEGKREYTVTGTATVKHPSGGTRFPPPESCK